MTQTSPNLIVDKQAGLGLLTLNKPSALNALDEQMIRSLAKSLADFESDDSITAIMVRTDNEKAFCAGGDMKHIRELCINSQQQEALEFFRTEYALNLAISRCSKPYIALINGIAMGGGLGISIHGRYRIVTPETRMAMPETRIGYFPDVGASYFLPRLNYDAGVWLAYTAAPIFGHQTVLAGLGTHCVSSENLNRLPELIAKAIQGSDDYQTSCTAIDTVLDELTLNSDIDEDKQMLLQRARWFASSMPATIEQTLTEASSESDDAAQLLELLQGASPFALQCTQELLRKGALVELDQCLANELEMAAIACAHPDLIEGVRAVLVDKDRNPQWQAPA